MAEKTRKKNFTKTEIEVLVGEVEARKNSLFDGHSSGITNKRKTSEKTENVTLYIVNHIKHIPKGTHL